MFNMLTNCDTVNISPEAALVTFHQQCTRVPVSPHLHEGLVFSVFFPNHRHPSRHEVVFLFFFFFNFGSFYLFICLSMQCVWSYFPDQGSNLGPPQWKCRLLTTGQVGKSLTGVLICISQWLMLLSIFLHIYWPFVYLP